MEELLRKILAQDKTLLARRDELISILEEKVPGRLMREYTPIKKALMLNIGEIFATGDNDRDAAISRATEILTQSGLQETRIKFVTDTFVKALDWDKDPNEIVEETAPPPPPPPVRTESSNKKSPAPAVSEVSQTQKQTPKKVTPPPPPAPPQTETPPAPQSSSSSTLIIGALVLVIVFLLFGRSDDSTPAETPAPVQETKVEQPQIEQPAPEPPKVEPPKVEPPKVESKDYLNAKTDLSLNGVDLGTPLNQVEKVLGKPKSTKNENNRLRYYYDDIEVVFSGDYLSAFVTYYAKYKTLRGLSVGSTYNEVLDKYGSAPHVMELDNLILYEYDAASIRGEKGLLRFAVSKADNKVNYISVRILEPEPPAPSSKPEPKENKIPQNVEQAARTFLSYHESITAKNYRKAYDLQTYDRKQFMGEYNHFAKGYENTVESKITELNLVSNDGDRVTLSYTLQAKDRAQNGTLQRTFKGEVEMVRDGGTWKINVVRSNKINERRI